MRTFEYRLYPNKDQARLLLACLIESRHIYNAMLETIKALYEQDGTFPSKYDLDAAWGQFLEILEAKAESAGHQVIRVNPRFTTQACSNCGTLIQKSLSVRTHICTSCGFIADRDVNAAKNILFKAGAQPSGANVSQ